MINIKQIEALLGLFTPISLDEMQDVCLMNRIDTKYITCRERWLDVLPYMSEDYRVQEIAGCRVAAYHTIYLDTADRAMFLTHQNGKTNREKIRVREYADTRQVFLEIKDKNNKGRTRKQRIPLENWTGELTGGAAGFIDERSCFRATELRAVLENRFDRVTLVNREKTERLTVDMNLRFRDMITGEEREIPRLVIIELKQDGNRPSMARELLTSFRVRPTGISKYCIGSVLTAPDLKHNRFKPKLLQINKTLNYELFT